MRNGRQVAPARIDHLLACLDGSPVGEAALRYALWLAQACEARVSLICVQEPVHHGDRHQPTDPLEWEIERVEAGEYLARRREEAEALGLRVETALLEGVAAEQILRFAREQDVDLIALASHGEKGITDWSLSGTAAKVIARANSSVLFVPAAWPSKCARREPGYRRILVPLDGSPRAECVLGPLTKLAKAHEATLILAHAVPAPELTPAAPPTRPELELVRQLAGRNQRVAERYLERIRARLAAEGLEVHTLVEHDGDAREALCNMVRSQDVDLVVLSAHGTTGDRSSSYGNVTRHLIFHARAPLLIVRDAPVRDAGLRETAEKRPVALPLTGGSSGTGGR